VGDVDSKGVRLSIGVEEIPTIAGVTTALLSLVPVARQEYLAGFIVALFKLFRDLNFVYMEINPLVFTDDGRITPLDMAAKIDETAHFLNSTKWGSISFPAPFGRAEYPEEAYIKKLDQSSGSSLKLTILNLHGRVWTMVAGGGASVVYADTISDLGFGHELANYGEYSGAPTLQETYEYAKTIFKLIVRYKDPRGKVLIIGGGIANFTDVAAKNSVKNYSRMVFKFGFVVLGQIIKKDSRICERLPINWVFQFIFMALRLISLLLFH
jgi:ATP citrate (pro-S)-lyase